MSTIYSLVGYKP